MQTCSMTRTVRLSVDMLKRFQSNDDVGLDRFVKLSSVASPTMKRQFSYLL